MTNSNKNKIKIDLSKYEHCYSDSDNILRLDFICIPLARMIQKEGKLCLNEIIEMTGFARQTVVNHLKHLTKKNILNREVKKQAKGRPRVFYYRTDVPIWVLKRDDVVCLTFKRLSFVCRSQKEGKCLRINKYCSIDSCPLKNR